MMNKIFGICAIAAVAAGVAILVSKCMKAVKEDEDIDDIEYDMLDEDCKAILDEEYKGTDSSLRNKMDEIFEQAVKDLREVKTSTTEFCNAVKDILAEKKSEKKVDQDSGELKKPEQF